MRLGINIDHVATLRNARGGVEPDPVAAAEVALRAGADQITIHLREDRRHIIDLDLQRLRQVMTVDLNLEMAATDEMVAIALEQRPDQVTLVPEKREERTTEGGLDLSDPSRLAGHIATLKKGGIPVVLFVEPTIEAMKSSTDLGVDGVELHTGSYANAVGSEREQELEAIRLAAADGVARGLLMHAGHGLDYDNTQAVAQIVDIRELNIGHSVVSRAVFDGFEKAVSDMKKLMQRSRS